MMYKVLYEFRNCFKAVVIAIPPGMAESVERATSYERFVRTFQEPNKFLLYWNGMSPSRVLTEEWVTVIEVPEEELPGWDTKEDPSTMEQEQGTEAEMASMSELPQQGERQSLADVAEILQNQVGIDEEEQDETVEQAEDTLERSAVTSALALVDEYPFCNFDNVVPVECVEYDGANFTLRLVDAIGEMIKMEVEGRKQEPRRLFVIRTERMASFCARTSQTMGPSIWRCLVRAD